MRKLSQRELLDEGISSMLSGITRGLRNATGSIATAIAPETMGALKKGAGIAAGAIERIRSGSPTAAAGSFFDSEDGKREFKDIKLGEDTTLPNQNIKIEVKSGYYLNSTGGDQIEEKDLSGGYIILRRKKRGGAGGFDNEITEVWDNTGKRLNDKPIKAGSDDLPAATSGPEGKPEAELGPNNPKFFASLKQWKIDNLGSEAGTVSATGIQLKEFLKTLKVEDPDRVLKQADIKVDGTIPENKKLHTLETIIKSRGLVAESIRSQKNILRLLNAKRYR